MQYPQIQFYRGSLVRLASGKLKQVEDLNSDDFLESARLVRSSSAATSFNLHCNSQQASGNRAPSVHSSVNLFKHRPSYLSQHQLNENNNNSNNSVFNSPEPTPSFDSPTMDLMETEDDDFNEEDDDEELDVVSGGIEHLEQSNGSTSRTDSAQHQFNQQPAALNQDDLYIDSSVVRDFLEVEIPSLVSSPASSTSSEQPTATSLHPFAPISSSSNSQPASPAFNQTVLIKFFLESSRSIVFIEVPIEHPFFVFHRGWSSWNPQRTYDKFGLKCRKLKIGDTCISLIRKQTSQQQQQQQQQQQKQNHLTPSHSRQQESDQCNVLFSSIKLE